MKLGSGRALRILVSAWILFFVIVPLVMTFVLSLFARDAGGGFSHTLTLQNIANVFLPQYLSILFKSLRLALLTGMLCTLIGFPVAYVIATADRKQQLYLYGLLLVPFWTNFIVRTYALRTLFSPAGLDLQLNPTLFVQMGMVMNYLPLFVLPCAVAIERLPASVWEAATDLGARRPTIWLKIIFPLLRKPLMHGFLMIFVPALGEFVIPDILGGAQGFYLGGLISEEFLKLRNWPFGAALSLLLMLSASSILFLERKEEV